MLKMRTEQVTEYQMEIIGMSFDKWMLEERHKQAEKTEDDWLIFAVDSQDSCCVFAYGGPPANNQTPLCCVELELEGLSHRELMDSIEWRIEFPSLPGVYKFTGRFSWFESRDWETGIVDDWHLIAQSGVIKPLWQLAASN